MTVSRILEKKGHRVFSIAETATLREAVGALARHHVGALVVTGADGSEPVGMLSERDVVREIAGHADGMDLQVADAMTRLVCKCGLDDTEGEIMEKMAKSGVRHLPVSHMGKLVGVVSTRDLLQLRMDKLNELMAEIMSEAAETP